MKIGEGISLAAPQATEKRSAACTAIFGMGNVLNIHGCISAPVAISVLLLALALAGDDFQSCIASVRSGVAVRASK